MLLREAKPLAQGCTQSKCLTGLGWAGGIKGPSWGGPSTSPFAASHLPLDKLVPVVAGERPAKRKKPQDVRGGRNRNCQPDWGGSGVGVGWGWNSNAFLTGDPRQWGQPLTQDQALKTPGQVTLVQGQP